MKSTQIKKIIVGVLAVMMVMTVAVGCTTDNTETGEADESVVVPDPVTEPEPEPELEEPIQGKDELEVNILEIMRESYDGMADVSFNDDTKTFVVIPYDNDVVRGAMGAKQGNVELLESWGHLVDSFAGMSDTISNELGGGYVIEMRNPANTENILLIIMDGVVIYDSVEG